MSAATSARARAGARRRLAERGARRRSGRREGREGGHSCADRRSRRGVVRDRAVRDVDDSRSAPKAARGRFRERARREGRADGGFSSARTGGVGEGDRARAGLGTRRRERGARACARGGRGSAARRDVILPRTIPYVFGALMTVFAVGKMCCASSFSSSPTLATKRSLVARRGQRGDARRKRHASASSPRAPAGEPPRWSPCDCPSSRSCTPPRWGRPRRRAPRERASAGRERPRPRTAATDPATAIASRRPRRCDA